MAELSTLSPSPPPLGDPHGAPPMVPSPSALPHSTKPAAESLKEIPLPKSSLYNDKALTGSTPAAFSGGSPLTPNQSRSPTKLASETSPPPLVQKAASPTGESAGNKPETGANINKLETVGGDQAVAEHLNQPSELAAETSAQRTVLQVSPTPDLSPGPNQSVSSNPNPVLDNGQLTQSVDYNPTPASSATSTTDEEKPRPLQQAQKPQTEPPAPLSPKPDPSSQARKEERPTTPSRAGQCSPTVPLIHEPAFPIPNANRKPALDNLSYLESASLMSGTLESLSGLGEDGSSIGSDSEINGLTTRRTDKYGFLGGSQYSEGR